jgi:hypothetical protein
VDVWHKVSIDKWAAEKPSALYYVELTLPKLRAAAAKDQGGSKADGSSALVAAEEQTACPRIAVLAELHSRLVSEGLRTYRFEASGAGLDCWQSPLQMRGMTLQCEGFSDTLPQYITSTLHAIRELKPEQVALSHDIAALSRHDHHGLATT